MTWIFCAGMIRSGSTLQFQLAASIVENAGLGGRLKYFPEFEFETVKKLYSKDDGLKVIKVHICTNDLYELVVDGHAKVIYSYRDIRDVTVSAMKKFDMTFTELIKNGWIDQAIEDYKKWTSLPNVLISRYEDFSNNLEYESSRINNFLGSPLDGGMVKFISNEFEITRQLERISKLNSTEHDRIERGEIVYDPIEQLHHNHIADGAIGKWRTTLNEAQIYYLNSRFEKWLTDNDYLLKNEINHDSGFFQKIDFDQLSRYWELSASLDKTRLDKVNDLLMLERNNLQQARKWAERTELLLHEELVKNSHLMQWSENAEKQLAEERELAAQTREWADRTEKQLSEVKLVNLELQEWAKKTEMRLVEEQGDAQRSRDLIERIEGELKLEKERSIELLHWSVSSDQQVEEVKMRAQGNREWAERTEKLLLLEQEKNFELLKWANSSDQQVEEAKMRAQGNREWAERTEKLLLLEQEKNFELLKWANSSDQQVEAAKMRAQGNREWAERTEKLLLLEQEKNFELLKWANSSDQQVEEAKIHAQEIREWAERTEKRVLEEKVISKKLMDIIAGLEQMLNLENNKNIELSSTIESLTDKLLYTQGVSFLQKEILNSRRKLFTRLISRRVSND